jgi:hypothetical protein
MPSAKRGVWPAFLLCWIVFACMFAPGCSCEPERQAQSNNLTVCRSQHDKLAVFPRRTSQLALMPGTTPVSFGVTDTGESAVSMPLIVPPGRAGVEPSLAISYSSAGSNGGRFSITGASSITRCPKNMAIDGTIREVDYSFEDARCLDGKRLVIVAQNGESIEYRTLPDSQVKVVEYLATTDESYFEAFLPSGWIVSYGTNDGSRPLAKNGNPRAWLATETRDARGSTMTYGYCFVEATMGLSQNMHLTKFDTRDSTASKGRVRFHSCTARKTPTTCGRFMPRVMRSKAVCASMKYKRASVTTSYADTNSVTSKAKRRGERGSCRRENAARTGLQTRESISIRRSTYGVRAYRYDDSGADVSACELYARGF